MDAGVRYPCVAHPHPAARRNAKGTGKQDPITSASGWSEMASQSNGASFRCWSELDCGPGTACKDFSLPRSRGACVEFAAGGQLVDLQVISSHPLGGKAAFETGPDLCPVQMGDSRYRRHRLLERVHDETGRTVFQYFGD